MKLGFLTACMPERPLSEVVHVATTAGYQMLEVACWPRSGERDHHASHIDVATLDEAGAREIRGLMEHSGLAISALAYYENNLAADPNERAVVNGHLRKAVDAAQLLGVGLVGTFVGNDLSKTPTENVEEEAAVFGELTAYAGERGVRLMIENCPMVGWQRPYTPGNLCYAPAQWDELFARVPDLGLNIDPSHLYWLGVDPYAAARDYGARASCTPTPRTPRSCASGTRASPSWTTAGGATACPAWANSTGRASSARCKRAATTLCSAPSMRTPSGKARPTKLTAASPWASASSRRCCIIPHKRAGTVARCSDRYAVLRGGARPTKWQTGLNPRLMSMGADVVIAII